MLNFKYRKLGGKSEMSVIKTKINNIHADIETCMYVYGCGYT